MNETPHAHLMESMHQDVIRIAQQLIRIDTSNWGDSRETVGEAEAAEYCAHELSEAGYSPELFWTTSGRRGGVAVKVAGSEVERDPLLIHAHLDCVPAIVADWSHPPFDAVVDDDGYLWGRGAVDMKNTVACLIAVLRQWTRCGTIPRRDLIVLLLPDEEAGGNHGARWVTRNRQDLLGGASQAIGEVGAFSVQIGANTRLYPIQVAEKGILQVQLSAKGRGGHASLVHPDNPIPELASALQRVTSHDWSTEIPPEMLELEAVLSAHGVDLGSWRLSTPALGELWRVIEASRMHVVNPTVLESGYKVNVVPTEARAVIDARLTHAGHELALDTIRRLAGARIEVEVLHEDPPVQGEFATPLVGSMASALQAVDPTAVIAPFVVAGSTDAKAFAPLGIECYGFTPVLLPAGTPYWSLFHSTDERVPTVGLEFGCQVLSHFMEDA